MRHLQNLVHPHIVPVLELGEGQYAGYFVMPLMEKGNLRNLLSLKQRLEPKLVVRLAYQIASALEFAHINGIIHRDVKPQNVLLDGAFQAYLSDFWLSLSMCNDALVEVAGRHIEGTLAYLSPTRASGKSEDTRGDIYSFGAVLYEMLTGCPPYQGATQYEVLFQILIGPPKPIKVRCPEALPGLVQIAESATARNLRERYPQMSFIMEDLNKLDREHDAVALKSP